MKKSRLTDGGNYAMSEDKVLELLEIYMDLTDKQDEIIFQLGKLVKKQATELAHLRNLLNVETNETQVDVNTAKEIICKYEEIKS